MLIYCLIARSLEKNFFTISFKISFNTLTDYYTTIKLSFASKELIFRFFSNLN